MTPYTQNIHAEIGFSENACMTKNFSANSLAREGRLKEVCERLDRGRKAAGK